ncbi:P-loop containing nucleoside triphosphate hydrolase protein, partial [Mycena polygramma]
MPAVFSRLDSRIRDAQKSAKILKKAREDAFKERGYQSAPTRAKIRNEFAERNDGMVAHEWQIDMGEALVLGLDCSLIAGTGAGKTMPFVMPLFVESDKMIIIISPLNALEIDQAARFRKMGLSAVAVNGDTYSNEIHKEIQEFKHRVIITSPDMCLKHDKFRQLLSTPAFAKKIAAFVVDEAHCISQWGDSFRTEYAELGTLRAFVPLKVPFMVASATLPPLVLAEVRKSMYMSTETSYHVNLGTDRPNIAWFVQHMKGAKSALESLGFLVPPHASEDELVELVQTMVFFDDINLAMEALEYLRDLLPPSARGSIALYHSRRSKRSKRIVMEKFRNGEIKILLATEAAGMGCDISHIEQVVQFMVPSSLSIWMQRAGRAGRNILIAARAILLVQPSVFKEVAPKKGAEPTEDVTFQKKVEDGLRAWIETDECRRDTADEYFDNGTVRTGTFNSMLCFPIAHSTKLAPTGICCDNSLLSDEVLGKIALRAHIKTPDDLVHAGWSPTHARKHGAEILAKLSQFDIEYKLQRAATNKRKMDEQKADTAKRQ